MNKINIVNKKATFEYQFIEKWVAGIQLTGTEIKSIREGNANIKEAYCLFDKSELWIRGMHIAEYSMGSYLNHEPTRLRKLLLHKRELRKIEGKIKEKGLTLIPFRLFISENGLAKVEIALAKGKKMYDKRNSIKEKDMKREMDRAKKGR